MAEPAPSFQVSYPENVRAALKEMTERARAQGSAEKMLAALKAIDSRLQQDPRSFGEPKYHYRDLKLVLHVALQSPLVVHFTIHEELPLVFVKSIAALPGQGI